MTASGTQQDRGPGQPSFQSLLYRNYGPMARKAKGTVNGFAEAVFDSGADATASRALATGAAAPAAVPVMAMAADKESAESESLADGQGNADAQENGSPHIQLRTNLRTASSGAARSKRMKKETLPYPWKCRTT